MTSRVAITLLKSLEQSLDDYCELNDEGKTAFSMAISALELFGNSEQLPSAQPERCEDCENFSRTRLLIPQPEIIRCKDCIMHGVCRYEQGLGADGYCSQAERRTDE